MARATPYGDRKQSIELCLDCYRSCIEAPEEFRLCEQCAADCAALGGQYRPHYRTTQLEPVLTHPRARPQSAS
jgi:hypothetical protein